MSEDLLDIVNELEEELKKSLISTSIRLVVLGDENKKLRKALEHCELDLSTEDIYALPALLEYIRKALK